MITWAVLGKRHMQPMINKIQETIFDSERPAIQNILAFVFLAMMVVIFITYGSTTPVYLMFVILAAFFIMPSYNYLGLVLIIFLTMLFEKFFTLQPLFFDNNLYKIYPLDIVMILTMLAWAINWRWGKDKPKLVFGWPEKILLIFLIMVVLYLLRSLVDINAKFSVSFSSFKNYTWYPLLYFITLYTVQSEKKLKNLINVMMLTGILIIGFIIAGIARGQGLWTEFTPLSTVGVRLLASTHAFYLLLLVIMAFSLYAFDRFKNNIIASLIIWFWLLGVLVSLMRHLWLALALGLIALFLFLPKSGKKLLLSHGAKNALIMLTITSVIFLIASLLVIQNTGLDLYGSMNTVYQRLTSIFQNDSDTSAMWRLDLWYSAQKIWLMDPILGVGFGKQILIDWNDWQTFEEIRNLHNSPLTIMVQMGLIGLFVFLAFTVSVMASSIKNIINDSDLRPYYLGLFIGILVYLFCSLFQPYLETNLTGIFFWILLGLLRTGSFLNQDKDKIAVAYQEAR